MNPRKRVLRNTLRSVVVLICTIALLRNDIQVYALSSRSAHSSSPQDQVAKISADQLDSLVAPLALYPDPLLAQVLAASTYPLEIVQLQQWLSKNLTLKDKELADAVAKQPWDPTVQALAALPDVVKRLADDIKWTTDLGNAFLAQQSDVMDAVQRMRAKAQAKGTLKPTEQMKVETKVVENKQVIVIEQADPQVIYVPSYDPVVVYGPAVYPYPPIYYPPAGYYAAGLFVSFGVGVMMGAFWSGGWCCGAGWGGNNVYINRDNNFNRNTNIGGNRPSQLPNRGAGDRGNLGNRGGGLGDRGNRPSTLPSGGDRSSWNHNPQHRGGAPYRDRATADRFGGTARGDSLANRQASARQQLGRQGGNLASNRAGNGVGRAGGGAGNRVGGGGQNSIGGRDLSRGGAGNRDAFGGGSRGSRGYNGSSARASSTRGASSMRSQGGGFSGRRGGGGGGRRR